MKKITESQMQAILKEGRYNKKVLSELRLGLLETMDWENLDFFTLSDKANQKGLLFYETEDRILIIPYRITRKTPSLDGRNKAVICDICKTWRKGDATGLLNIIDPGNKHRTTGCYTCLDLNCSLHVRDLTPQAMLSRTQLRESITIPNRIARLHQNFDNLLSRISEDKITSYSNQNYKINHTP